MTQRKTGPNTPNTTGPSVPLNDARIATDTIVTAAEIADLIRGDLDPRDFAEKITDALGAQPELIEQVRKLLANEDPTVAMAALRGVKSWDPGIAIEEAAKLVMDPRTSLEAFQILQNLSPRAAERSLAILCQSEVPVLKALGAHIEAAYLAPA